ncbi:hypothetical protein NFI96_000376, partial [Prochilodus magdalenae]
ESYPTDCDLRLRSLGCGYQSHHITKPVLDVLHLFSLDPQSEVPDRRRCRLRATFLILLILSLMIFFRMNLSEVSDIWTTMHGIYNRTYSAVTPDADLIITHANATFVQVENKWTTPHSATPAATMVEQCKAETRYHVAYPCDYNYILNEPERCQKENPFLVLMVPVAPGNREARDAVRSTWGSEKMVMNKVVSLFFMLGQPSSETGEEQTQKLLQEREEYHDIVQSDFLDSYKNLTIKTMVIMEWLTSHCQNASYAMKIDSDMFLNVDTLVNMLLKAPSQDYLTGLIGMHSGVIRDPGSKWYFPKDVFPDDFYPPYALGLGYVFSMDLPEKLVEGAKYVKAVYIEDVYIGLIMKYLGIPVTQSGPGLFNGFGVTYNRCTYSKLIVAITSNLQQQERPKPNLILMQVNGTRFSPSKMDKSAGDGYSLDPQSEGSGRRRCRLRASFLLLLILSLMIYFGMNLSEVSDIWTTMHKIYNRTYSTVTSDADLITTHANATFVQVENKTTSHGATPAATTEEEQCKAETRYHVAYPCDYNYILNEPERCQKENPFLVLMVPVAPGNREARDAVRSTWGSEKMVMDKVVSLFFMLGQPSSETGEEQTQKLLQEREEYHDIVQSDFLDSYENLTIKTMVIMEWLTSHCQNASYAMKIDSDMFLNVDTLVNMLLKAPSQDYLTGLVAINGRVLRDPGSKWYFPKDVFPDDFYPPYALGLGYVFSMDLPEKLVEGAKYVKAVYIEDVYIGLIMKYLGIPVTQSGPGLFNIFPVPYNRCTYSKLIATTTNNLQQQLKEFNLPQTLMIQFYTAIIESILTASIIIWFGSSTSQEGTKLQRFIRTAERIIGCNLPSLQQIYTSRKKEYTQEALSKGSVQSRLYLLKRLRSFGVQRALLRTLFDTVVASAIFYGVVCWGSSISTADRKRQNKLLKSYGSVLGSPLDPGQVVGDRRMLAKLASMLENDSHSMHETLAALGSSFSDRLLHPKCVKERYRSFSLDPQPQGSDLRRCRLRASFLLLLILSLMIFFRMNFSEVSDIWTTMHIIYNRTHSTVTSDADLITTHANATFENKTTSHSATPAATTVEQCQVETQYHVAYPCDYNYILNEPERCQKENPFLVLMVPVAPGNREARDALRSTWGSEKMVMNKVVSLFFILGQPSSETGEEQTQKLLQESEEYHDIVQSDFLDSYKNLTIKTMVIMEWLTSHCQNASYAMKIDSDMFLNVDSLVNMLLKAPSQDYLTGLVEMHATVNQDPQSKWYFPKDVFPDDFYPPYALGLGYVFSMDLPEKLVEGAKYVRAVYIEDVYIGLIMKYLGIRLTHSGPGLFNVFPVPYNRCSYSKLIATTTNNLQQQNSGDRERTGTADWEHVSVMSSSVALWEVESGRAKEPERPRGVTSPPPKEAERDED